MAVVGPGAAGLDENLVAEAVQHRREAGELSRRVRGESRAEQARRTAAAGELRERLGSGLLDAAGVTPQELAALRAGDEQAAREFAGRQRVALAARGAVVAAEHRSAAAHLPARLASAAGQQQLDPDLVFHSLVSLESANWFDVPTPRSDQGFVVNSEIEPGERNAVKLFVQWTTQLQRGFHIPGLPATVSADLLFVYFPDTDLAVNAISFVQPNGAYEMVNGFEWFATAGASVEFSSGLDILILDPGARTFRTVPDVPDIGLQREIEIGWLDVLGKFDIGPYSDQTVLNNSNLARVEAGAAVVFDVWVDLTVWADGHAVSQLDFLSGDFEVTVPGVYAFTYTPS